MKILHSARLDFFPASQKDASWLRELWVLPEVREYLWDNEVIPTSQVEIILAENEILFREKGWGLWLLRNHDSKWIGFAGLWTFFEESQPQLLYGLHPSQIKKGYAIEASKRIMKYAFEELEFEYLTASCDLPHQESIRVLERIGMTKIEVKTIYNKATVFYQKTNNDASNNI